MKLDFDIDNIQKNKIELLNCEIDLILRSLEFYCYTYNFIYPRSAKSKTKEENLRVSLVRDTYHQILVQYKNRNEKNSNLESKIFKEVEKNLKNIA